MARTNPSGRDLVIAVLIVGAIIWFVATRNPWESFSRDRFWKLDRAFADPTVIYADDEYHVYTTSAAQCVPGNCPIYWVPHFTSKSLAEPGGLRGDAMPELPAWVDPVDRSIWAPAVAQVGAGYLMYFSASAARDPFAGIKCLGVAASAAPAGPFVPFPDPLWCEPGFWNVDPYLVGDPTGLYLLWREDDAANVTGKIVGTQLTPDGLAFAGGPVQTLLVGEFAWEEGYPDGAAAVSPDDATATDRQLPAALPSLPGIGPIENPAMALDHDTGQWLLAWSANRWESKDYATGLATCQGPLGPCTALSRESPWLRTSSDPAITTSAEFGGSGGLSFVVPPDNHLYAVFHAYRGDGQFPDAPRLGWAYRVESKGDRYALTEFR